MSLIPSYDLIHCAIESQYVGPNIASALALARGAGRFIEAMCENDIPYEMVNPKSWQSKELGKGKMKRDQLKKLSVQKVNALYGLHEKEHYATDAILIARYMLIERAGR